MSPIVLRRPIVRRVDDIANWRDVPDFFGELLCAGAGTGDLWRRGLRHVAAVICCGTHRVAPTLRRARRSVCHTAPGIRGGVHGGAPAPDSRFDGAIATV
jgi:hypothetical protein